MKAAGRHILTQKSLFKIELVKDELDCLPCGGLYGKCCIEIYISNSHSHI